MKIFRAALGLLALPATTHSARAQTPDKDAIVEPLDMEMVKRNHNFGYSDEEIQKFFNVPLKITLDRSSMSRSLLNSPARRRIRWPTRF